MSVGGSPSLVLLLLLLLSLGDGGVDLRPGALLHGGAGRQRRLLRQRVQICARLRETNEAKREETRAKIKKKQQEKGAQRPERGPGG